MVLLETAVTVRFWFSFDGPKLTPANPTSKVTAPATMPTSGMGSSVGGSFTEATVKRNELLALAVPSLTRRVIVVVPDPFAAGMMVAVRLVPAPPIKMFPLGTRFVFDELPVTVNRNGDVSASLTVKGTVIGTSSGVVRAGRLEMTGGSFTAATVTLTLLLKAEF